MKNMDRSVSLIRGVAVFLRPHTTSSEELSRIISFTPEPENPQMNANANATAYANKTETTADHLRHSPAHIILQQLGANRLAAMIGAKGFTITNNDQTLIFKHMPAARCCPANGSTCIRITYDRGADLYDIEFYKPGRLNRTTYEYSPDLIKHTSRGIYAEDMHDVIESATGLSLRL
jgi:hypothetical protein